MPWPLSQDYNEAIQNPASSLGDPELQGGRPVTGALGMPMPRSGNFADVYEFVGASGAKWAIKCFTRAVPGLRERYTEISKHLVQAKLPFTVDFDFLARGIRIRGDWYPVLKMKWVEGLLLNEFVRNNLDKPALLEALGQIWPRMAKCLRDANMAHADLQHGNVLLVPSRSASHLSLKLIDYDGMWVPTLANKKSGEVGHPNYQHPQRLQQGTYTADVDRLPLLVVACAVRCLVVGGKSLWDRYDNGDNLLFREVDLQAPGNSPLFKELHRLPDPQARMLVKVLQEALARKLEHVPAIDTLLPETKPASVNVPASPPMISKAVPPRAAVTPSQTPGAVAKMAPISAKSVPPVVIAPPGRKAAPQADYEESSGTFGRVVGGLALVAISLLLLGGLGYLFWTNVLPDRISDADKSTLPIEPGLGTKDSEKPPSKDGIAESKKDGKPPTGGGDEDVANLPKKEKPDKPPVVTEPKIKAPDDKKADDKKADDNKLAEQKLAEQKLAEQKLAEQKLAEQKLAEQKLAEQKLAEQKLAEQKLAEQKLKAKDPANKFTNSLGMTFALVPKGKAWLGGGGGKVGKQEVEILHDFHLGVYDVTQEEWELVMGQGTNPSHFSRKGKEKDAVKNVPDVALKRFPVDNVSWNDCQEFVARLNKFLSESGWMYRLPTETEWEYACRGGSLEKKEEYGFDFYFDLPTNTVSKDSANVRQTGLLRTCKVGAYAANKLGLYDMHGNVGQWCDDRLGPGPDRVVRGGSWSFDGRAAHRIKRAPSDRAAWLGFRLARVPVDKEIANLPPKHGPQKDGPPQPNPLKEVPTLILEVPADGTRTGGAPLAFSHDCKRLARGGKDGDVRLWDIDKGQEPLILKGHNSPVAKMVFSLDSKRLAAGWQDGTVRVWDLDKGKVPVFQGMTNSVFAVAFSSDGRRLAAWSTGRRAEEFKMRLWDVDKGRELLVVDNASISLADDKAFSPDGKVLATTQGQDGRLWLWDANNGGGLRVLNGHSQSVLRVAFSPDGKQLSTASFDGTVRLWDVNKGVRLRVLNGLSTSGFSGAFSSDSKRLATRGLNDMQEPLQVWDIEKGQGPHILKGHTKTVWALAFSPDGKRLATWSFDGTMRFWDVENLQELRVVQANSASLSFSPDGMRLATASQGGRVQVWDVDNGRQLFDLEGHTQSGFVVYSTDGARLATYWQDGTVRVWDLHTKKEEPEKGLDPGEKGGEATKAVQLEFDDGKLTVMNELTNQDPMHRGKCYKEYTFVGEAGKTYTINLHSKEFDAYLYLKDDTGEILAKNDDAEVGNNDSRIVYKAQNARVYHVIATRTDLIGPKTGKFRLTIVETDANPKPKTELDPQSKTDPDLPGPKTVLDINSQLVASDLLGGPKRRKFKTHEVKLQAGYTYVIEIKNLGVSKLTPYLQLLDPTDKVVAEDGGDNRNARVTFMPTQDGTYKVVATSIIGGIQTGAYNLTITAVTAKVKE